MKNFNHTKKIINAKSLRWRMTILWYKLKDRLLYTIRKMRQKSIMSIIGDGSRLLCKFPNENPRVVVIKRIWVEFGHNGDYDKFYIMADTTLGMSTINALLQHAEYVKIL